jgi:NADPH-dependent 2,4-dienoyl-CoA reductase/sulfur reductase-like enzyme
MDRIVVVGGSIAGVNAIARLRDDGHQGEITLVTSENHLPYDRPPLSKEALRTGPALESLLLKEASWYAEQDVKLRLGVTATHLDPAAHRLGIGAAEALPYDGLVIATGCSSRPLAAFRGARKVHTLRDLSDAVALHQQLRPGRHVVVIGAGFIGLEVAATARQLGLDVSVVELAPAPLSRVLGHAAGEWFRGFHAERGVDIHCGSSVVKLCETKGGTHIQLSNGTTLTSDVLVAGIGVTPATQWLESSGIELDDGIVCDSSLQTSLPGVVAAGDVVRWHHELFDETMRVEQWLNAVEQGQHAARTLAGQPKPFDVVPYFWSDQFEAMVRFVGRADGADAVEVKRISDRSMVALFARDGVIRGALCINAPRQLARCKVAITNRLPWSGRAEIL